MENPAEINPAQVLPKEPEFKAQDLRNAIPDLTEVDLPSICGTFCRKDGLLLFHFYLPVRRAIMAKAEQVIAEINDKKLDEESSNALKRQALQGIHLEFQRNPWPKDFGMWLATVIPEIFKYQSFRTNYYEEVDSWSAGVKENQGIIPYSDDLCQAVFTKINEKFTS
jgi:hypothetical protein